MNLIKQNDLKKGQISENKVYELLKHLDIKKTKPFHTFDFKNKHCYFEVKSRNNDYNKYPATMVGYNKIKMAENNYDKYKFIFIFDFYDGIYYYQFSKNDNLKPNIGGRNDRGYNEYNDYVYIPIEKLKPLTKDIIF